ncbi:DUF6708 domain-containing protein [Ectopseudomonas khazarica]|uniref:DUF6708 domain-containing protein n=1 Tax=Ectopseudomonas khazarica TaxID=2502979 RepID=UPI00106E5ECE|nr:DUF6708 domain-containing protein [Pseudomonas khazarica]
MAEDKYERLPRAGDSEHQLGFETLYLAPKPLPAGQVPFSAQQMHREVNECYLDFAAGGGTREFAVRVTIGTLLLLSLVLVFSALLGAWLQVGVSSRFWSYAGQYLVYSLLLLSFFFAMFGSIIVYAAYKETRTPPIRFNRQRREVCYVPAKGKPVFILWEEVIACVAVEQVITQYSATQQFRLRLGFHDTTNEQMHWVTHAHASLMLAVSEWEALRVYMEQGPTALPPAPQREHEEGTLEYFYFARDTYKECHGFISYGGWWLLQLFTGWTIPCHIAEWFEHLPKAGFPKAVREWSKNLPTEQWAKPSEELLSQSAAIEAAFATGLSFPEYFKSPLVAFQSPSDAAPVKTKGKGKRARSRAAAETRASDPQEPRNARDASAGRPDH